MDAGLSAGSGGAIGGTCWVDRDPSASLRAGSSQKALEDEAPGTQRRPNYHQPFFNPLCSSMFHSIKSYFHYVGYGLAFLHFYGSVGGVSLLRGWRSFLKALTTGETAISVAPSPNPRAERATGSVGVISKVLLIFEALQNSSVGLGLKGICDATGINKSTAHRFVKHLQREGYLLHTEAGAYLIGPRLAQMSACAGRTATLQAVARPILADLWRSTQETVNLGVLDHGTLLYVDVMESPHEFRLVSRIGTRRPLHVAALGKVLTAFLPSTEYERALSGIVFQRMTKKTISNVSQLRAELENVRRQGYAVDNEEALLGCRCVSAPILNRDKVAVGALSVAGPVTRVNLARVPALAREVKAAARDVSAAMGFSKNSRTRSGRGVSPRTVSA